MRLDREDRHHLAGIGQADLEAVRPEGSEESIVVARAVAQPVAAAVEAHAGHHHQVQGPRGHRRAVGEGLADAVGPHPKLAAMEDAAEDEPLLRAHHGREGDGLAGAAKEEAEARGGDLAPKIGVEAHDLGGHGLGQGEEGQGRRPPRPAAKRRGQRRPAPQQLVAPGALVRGTTP